MDDLQQPSWCGSSHSGEAINMLSGVWKYFLDSFLPLNFIAQLTGVKTEHSWDKSAIRLRSCFISLRCLKQESFIRR